MQMTKDKELFLQIVRHALWSDGNFVFDQNDSDITQTTAGKILKIAKDQAMIGIVGDVVLNHSENIQIEHQKALKTGFKILKIQNRHALVLDIISDLDKRFKSNNLELTLLKGEGVGSLYPNPSLRQSGDADIYIGKDQYEKGVEILSAIKDPDKEFSESDKHYECYYRGVSIELHRVADRFKFRPSKNKYFQNLTIEGIESSDRFIIAGEGKIKLPSAQFDALFSLEHLWNHMLKGGVGFRQVCDWSRILHTYSKELNLNKLEKDLRFCNLFDAWQYIGYIAVNHIGLPESECPFYSEDEKIVRIADELLEIIFEDGNFGAKNNKANEEGRPDNFVGSKWHSLKNNFRRLHMTMKYVTPSDRLAYYLGYIQESIHRLS